MRKLFIILFATFLAFGFIKNVASAAPYWEALGVKVSSDNLFKIKNMGQGTKENAMQMVKMFLNEMGYPDDLVRVEFYSKNSSGLGEDIEGGNFNFASGTLSLNTEFCQRVPAGALAAVIRHELDHFQMAAKLCKSIGIEEYQNIWADTELKKDFNKGFWQDAIKYTTATNFNSKKYLAGIVKYSSSVDYSSNYYVLVELTDGRRNPFEITAYAYSDLINDYFGTTKASETSLHNLATAFNTVDWGMYNISQKYKSLKNVRTAIFDYYYVRALFATNSNMYFLYKKSMQTGDYKAFFNSPYFDIFKGLKVQGGTAPNVSEIINFVNIMAQNMRQKLSEKDVQDIFRVKFFLLKTAMENPENNAYRAGNLLYMNNLINGYFAYLDERGIKDDKIKLLMLYEKFKINNTHILMPSGKTLKIGSFWDYFTIFFDVVSNAEFKKELEKRDLGDNIFGWIELFRQVTK